MDDNIIAVIRRFKGYGVLYNEELTNLMKKQYWTVQENYCFFLGDKFSDRWVVVPKGYGTDGATVPPAATFVLPVWGEHGAAVILHDWLCEYGYVWHKDKDGTMFKNFLTRDQIDQIFIEALKVIGADNFTINAVNAAFLIHRATAKPPVPNLDTRKQAWELNYRIQKGYTEPDASNLFAYLERQGEWPEKKVV